MEERENFYRFSALLLDVGARVLREVFTCHHLRSKNLASYLSLKKQHLLQLPVTVLSQEQLDTLFPPRRKKTKIEDLDITLLCILFRSLDSYKPSNHSVWTRPVKTDKSFQADVGRIRVIRNTLFGHVSSASLDNLAFNRETSNLTSIYKRLISPIPATKFTSNDLEQMIEKELKGPLQPDLENKISIMRAKLEEWQRYDEDLKQTFSDVKADVKDVKADTHEIKANMQELLDKRGDEDLKQILSGMNANIQEVLDKHRGSIEVKKQWDSLSASKILLEQHRSHAENNFVETQGYRDANEMLHQHRRLIITGKSGQGKTYMAYRLLNKIVADNPNIEPLIISTVEEWKDLVDSSATLGVIVDDMCGRFGLNEGELMKWKQESTYMPSLIENGKHVVIFTMKSYLYEKILEALQPKFSISCSPFSTEVILKLDMIGLKLEEKTEFAKRYLREFDLNDSEVSDLCEIHEAPVGFPQICKAAGMINQKSRLFEFFSNPREMILKQIKSFYQDERTTYGCLVLVMLFRGKLNLESIREFRDSSEGKENKVISVFSRCGIPDVMPRNVLDTLQSLQGIYVSFDVIDNSYSFNHDSIEEAVFISHGEFFLKETLLYCPLELVCKLCTVKYEFNSLEKTTQDNILILQPSCQAILINRFITALRGSNPTDFTIISEANVWSSKDFRKAFIVECKEIHYLADKDENSLLVHAAYANNRNLVEELLHELDNIPADKKKTVAQFLTKSAKLSCAHKDTYLLQKLCENNRVDANDILPNTIKRVSVDAIEFLLQSGADVNFRSENGLNLLHIACLHGRLDIVKLLHSRNANLVNKVYHDKRSVGLCVASGGSVEIMEFIVSLGLNPLSTDSTGWNLLHYACWHAKKDMAEHLLDKHPNLLSSVTEEGMSVLFCAAFGGNIYIFKKMYELLEPFLKADQSANSDANRTNDIRNMMGKTTNNETLLHMSCLGGNLEMTKYLVETYPKMLHEVDNSKSTPAHKAAFSGNVSVLRYLIDCGTDPWCRTSEEETLLHKACINGKLEMTKYLVETFPKMLHQVDNSKSTPAHHAAYGGNVAVLKYLIDCNTDPWCRTSEEETLLHIACIDGNLKMTKYLVETYPKMLHEVDNGKRTPAHKAASSGNVAVLRYLIDCGTDPWCRTSRDETLLNRACIKGKLEMTKYLVKTYPKMLHKVDNGKRTPAHDAASSGNVTVLMYLIDCNADPWCRTFEEETLLHRACIDGNLEMTKYLVETYPKMLHEVDNGNRTPAHKAAFSGTVTVLRYLIDCGTDPWCRTSQEETLLHRACINGKQEMTKYLVETFPKMLHEVDNGKRTPAHDAASSGNVSVLMYLIDRKTDPWCRTSEEETLLHRACYNGNLEMTKYLVETFPKMLHEVDNGKRTPAHDAASSGNVSVLMYLIDRKTDPWCRTSEEETLLHRACYNGNLEMTKYLVETYPKMLHQVDNSKRTPAHYATETGKVDVLRYLIDCGTDPWCRTSEKETLLHRACINGNLEMTKYLVETFPKMLHEVDNCKSTPAHHAAFSGNVAVLRYLIECDTDPWCRTSEEETLLHRACINGKLEMTKHLVETYPKMLHEVDNDKNTPAHHAAEGGNVAVLRYLIDRGTDPRCRNSEEETLLHRACINGRLEMTKYLVETFPKMLHEVDNDKSTPTDIAADTFNLGVLCYLRNAQQDNLSNASLEGRKGDGKEKLCKVM